MDKKNTLIKERILQLAKNKGFSYETFLTKVDLKYANFKGIQKKGGINSNSIGKILSEFPDVDLHWLVTGEQKIEKEKENIVMEEPDNYESGFKEKYLKMLEENRELRIQKESLQKSIDSLKKSDKQILDKS